MFWHLMYPFDFPALSRFIDRDGDLARLEDWWQGAETNALALYGRRRVGKSWLFRRFAHGKPAVVLVADRRAQGPQLDRFAEQLEPLLGIRPALDSVAALVEALYTLAGKRKILVVIDEFPYLLLRPTANAMMSSPACSASWRTGTHLSSSSFFVVPTSGRWSDCCPAHCAAG